MFYSSLCLTLAGMLLVVMIDEPGINGQMVSFDVRNPETPLPLYEPIKFKTIVKNVGNAYSDGNDLFNFLFLKKMLNVLNQFKLSLLYQLFSPMWFQ